MLAQITIQPHAGTDKVTCILQFDVDRRLSAAIVAWLLTDDQTASHRVTEEELALFDLLTRETLSKVDRERVKQASRTLLASVQSLIAPLERWTDKEQTQAEVEVLILDRVFESLPSPPFTDEEKQQVAARVYLHILQQSLSSRSIAI